jgi:FkbM family methyltransferase
MELKERVKHRNNVIIEEITIGDKDGEVPFYFVKKDSLDKLKKHWASGIGSFNKNHILSHKTKRFDIKEEDIEEINVKCLSFNSFVKKHSITSIDKLMMDIEGAEYNILKSINYDEIFIKNIVFEKKHFDGPFKEGVKLNEIKLLLSQKNYKLIDLDEENIQAVKK